MATRRICSSLRTGYILYIPSCLFISKKLCELIGWLLRVCSIYRREQTQALARGNEQIAQLAERETALRQIEVCVCVCVCIPGYTM